MKPTIKKTHVKGLYLTNDGKAWHKSSKCEIKPTTSGKIRFNGKLYDLQKLINLSGQNVPKTKVSKAKQQTKKAVSIRELQKDGFKKTKISGLYISKDGKAYNYNSKRNLTPTTKGTIIIDSKAYNLSKLILETFANIPVRSGQIYFTNGNDNDFSLLNVAYKSTIKEPLPVDSDLIKCIRLYFEVDKKFKKSNLLFKYYLNEIAVKRGFLFLHTGKGFDLFKEWLTFDLTIKSNSIYNLSLKNGFSARNGQNEIYKYLNLLITGCLQDFENRTLKLKDFKRKPPTKTQRLKAKQKALDELGINLKLTSRKRIFENRK